MILLEMLEEDGPEKEQVLQEVPVRWDSKGNSCKAGARGATALGVPSRIDICAQRYPYSYVSFLEKWRLGHSLLLAALGQYATARATAGVCSGKAAEVRERAEGEATPRKLVPGVGQNSYFCVSE